MTSVSKGCSSENHRIHTSMRTIGRTYVLTMAILCDYHLLEWSWYQSCDFSTEGCQLDHSLLDHVQPTFCMRLREYCEEWLIKLQWSRWWNPCCWWLDYFASFATSWCWRCWRSVQCSKVANGSCHLWKRSMLGELSRSRCEEHPAKAFLGWPWIQWGCTVMAIYQLYITGYKWDYTFYINGVITTYN